MFGLTKHTALILLSIWLTATGLFPLVDAGFSGAGVVPSLLTTASSVLIRSGATTGPRGSV